MAGFTNRKSSFLGLRRQWRGWWGTIGGASACSMRCLIQPEGANCQNKAQHLSSSQSTSLSDRHTAEHSVERTSSFSPPSQQQTALALVDSNSGLHKDKETHLQYTECLWHAGCNHQTCGMSWKVLKEHWMKFRHQSRVAAESSLKKMHYIEHILCDFAKNNNIILSSLI